MKMTREEAYKIDILTSTGFNTKIIVDKIYDDFEVDIKTCQKMAEKLAEYENRICSSCKYFDACEIQTTLIHNGLDCGMKNERINGYCSQWEK